MIVGPIIFMMYQYLLSIMRVIDEQSQHRSSPVMSLQLYSALRYNQRGRNLNALPAVPPHAPPHVQQSPAPRPPSPVHRGVAWDHWIWLWR